MLVRCFIGRRLCEGEGGDWRDVCISYGTLKLVSKLLEVRREVWDRFFFIVFGRN